jgi:hypothetical protein
VKLAQRLLCSRYQIGVSAMTSTLKLSGSDESKRDVLSAQVNPPQNGDTNWEDLRGLTTNAYEPHRSTRLRSALVAVLLIVGLGSLGLVLHNHVPALVSFGEELKETVHQLTEGPPTPSTASNGTALRDLRSSRKKVRPARTRVAESQPEDQPYDLSFRPFYATAIVGGRRVSLRSNHSIVLLNMDNGTWKFGSELE